MKIISNPLELKEYLKTVEGTIGFVPSMGALHEGHISLIKKAREQNDILVVSLFLNPTQFLKGEDLDNYPSRDEADRKICSMAHVDVLFLPTKEGMYSEDEASIMAPKVRGYVLEGATRPGHFSGVLTVVMKLLNLVNPTRAYFGKKDAQQLNLIMAMVKEFFMDVEIVPMDTVRDSDGLAKSSRNAYLSKEERVQALKISKSLYEASKMVSKNIHDIEAIKKEMRTILAPLKIAYVEILNRDFQIIKELEVGNSIILVEAFVGETRLLDNLWL